MSRPQIGRLGEDIAAAHLAARGWYILQRNFRVARGELDIIALDGSTLVFVEVKTRRTILSGVPQAAVDQRKLRRIRHLAGYYLMEHSPPHRDLRVDVLAVMVADDLPPEIEHVVGVGS
ncbi:YraN family protein [Brachybacterium sp. AOP25-B2-12]|uniref:YraN family protein n=1 Tax=Brachybacterium sp. AOP25-B2-12 TaxID=3457710 RepID=UPI004033D0F7